MEKSTILWLYVTSVHPRQPGEESPRRRPTSPTRHGLAVDEANTNHPQRSGADAHAHAHAAGGNKPPKPRPRAPTPQQKKQGRARHGRATATGDSRSRVLPLLRYFPPPARWPEGLNRPDAPAGGRHGGAAATSTEHDTTWISLQGDGAPIACRRGWVESNHNQYNYYSPIINAVLGLLLGCPAAAQEQPSSIGRPAAVTGLVAVHLQFVLAGAIHLQRPLASACPAQVPWRSGVAGKGSVSARTAFRRLRWLEQVVTGFCAPCQLQHHGRDHFRGRRGGDAPRAPHRGLRLLLEEDGAEEAAEASQSHAFLRGYLRQQSQQHVLHRRAAAAAAERHRRGAVDEHVRPDGASLALAARHELRRLLQPARSADATAGTAREAGASQGHVHLRGARGGDGRLLAGEPARAGRVRVRAQGGAPQRPGGGREAAQVRERAGGARVPGRGGHHQPGAPPPPRIPRRPLHRRRQPHARLRVRPQQDARVPPPWERVAADGMGDEAAHRARGGEGDRLPARRLPSTDHPSRHQVGQHPPGQQLRDQGRGLRAGQADVRRQHARLDAGHGHVRVPGAGVRVEREADGEVGRVLLRRDAGRAPDGAAAHRGLHAHVPGGRPRRMGEAGSVARAGGRRLRRRRRPEAGGKLRAGGDGPRGRQRRRLRPPVCQEAPEDEPDREGAGGRHVAGGPERRGAAGAEQAVRGGGGVVRLRHEPERRGGRGKPRVQRQVRTALASQQRHA